MLSRFMLATILAVILGNVQTLDARNLAQSDDHEMVRQAIDGFLADLGGLRVPAVEERLHKEMMLVVVRQTDKGMSASVSNRRNWLASLRAAKTPFVEDIMNVEITVDSASLAYVRADFTVSRDGKVLSHGVDQITLIKENGAWLISYVAYTSISGPPD